MSVNGPPYFSNPPPQNLRRTPPLKGHSITDKVQLKPVPAVVGGTQSAPRMRTMTTEHIDALIVGADQAVIAMSEPLR